MNPADEKLWATLIHIGGIFFYFVPAMIGYLVLKDRGPFIREHTATALNFQLTLLIAYVAGALLIVALRRVHPAGRRGCILDHFQHHRGAGGEQGRVLHLPDVDQVRELGLSRRAAAGRRHPPAAAPAGELESSRRWRPCRR